jgi:hypothetical protein
MKWMIWSVALMMAVVPAVVGAQFGTVKGKKRDKGKAKDWTLTGCVETGSKANTFVLTHIGADTAQMGKHATKKGAAAPQAVALTGNSIDLSNHVGHQVSVGGSVERDRAGAQGATGKNAATLTVNSLKMIATSCA